MIPLVELFSNRMCPATRCIQQPDVSSNQMCPCSNQMCPATRCVLQPDVSSNQMCPATGCVQQPDVSSNRMCPATRCVQQPDVSSNQMCPATKCVQFMVSLLYISQTCKFIYTLMLRCSLKFFLFYWELRKWKHVFTTTVHCLLFCSLQNHFLFHWELKKWKDNFPLSTVGSLQNVFHWELRKWKHMTTTFHCNYKSLVSKCFEFLPCFYNHTPSRKKTVTGVQVATASQVMYQV